MTLSSSAPTLWRMTPDFSAAEGPYHLSQTDQAARLEVHILRGCRDPEGTTLGGKHDANLIGAAMVWHHRFGKVMEHTS